MNEKLKSLNNILSKTKDNNSKLRVITFHGFYECLLLRKDYSDEGIITNILVKIEKDPGHKEGITINLDLNNNGLIEIQIIS